MKKDLHIQANPQIDVEQAWQQQHLTLIDARSQKEFAESHIPGSINIPLLDDEERETIGILYKNFGQNAALEQGYSFLDQKLSPFKQAFEALEPEKGYIVYCARGGMRSQVTTSFMRYLGFNASQLSGGYKAFRNWNINKLAEFTFAKPIILHGQTGVGKTLVLNKLANSLDLEGCADHRGSIFGGIGKNPVSQKTFEANLLLSLENLDNRKPIFIEGESRKVGDASIPDKIYQQMKSSKIFLLEASPEVRVARTIDEYITRQPEQKPLIRKTIQRLNRDLGNANTERLVSLFDQGCYEECFGYILENYYDKKYAHSIKKLTVDAVIQTDDLDAACQQIQEAAETLF